jgi:hypothetical protein
VPGLILAAINPDNTPHGYNWTFAFPMLLFVVVAALLYALFRRPHRRVPARAISADKGSRLPEAQAAGAASIAGGLSLGPGGGATESQHEPAGAHLAENVSPDDLKTDDGAPAESDPADADADRTGRTTAGDGTEDSE